VVIKSNKRSHECICPLYATEILNVENGQDKMELLSRENFNLALESQVSAMKTEVQLGITQLEACAKVYKATEREIQAKDMRIQELEAANEARGREIQAKDRRIQELQAAFDLFTSKNFMECPTVNFDRLRDSFKDFLFDVDKNRNNCHSEPKNTYAESMRVFNQLEKELARFARHTRARYVSTACFENPEDRVQGSKDFWDITTDKVDGATRNLENLNVLLRDTKSSGQSREEGLIKLLESLRALMQHCEEDKTDNPFNHSVVKSTPTNFFEVWLPKGFEVWLGTVFGRCVKAEKNKRKTHEEILMALMKHWSNHMSISDHQKYISLQASNTLHVEDAAHLASQKEASRMLKTIFPYAGRHKMPEMKVPGDNTTYNNPFFAFL